MELAAKAAGLIVHWHDSGHYGPTMEIMEDESGGPPWNPLTNDGDALRLAVKLGMKIDIFTNTVTITTAWGTYDADLRTDYINSRDEMCRIAIVRAAAGFGKAMQ